MKKLWIMMICTAALTAGCGERPQGTAVPAIDMTNLDTTVRPGDDFYAYATGGWQRLHPLKPEYARYGTFDILAENNEIRLNELFQSLPDLQPEQGSTDQKIADLYALGMDSVRLNAEGAAPVLKYLEALETIVSTADFAKATAGLKKYGDNGLWSVSVDADLTDCNKNMLYLGESGLSMGNRDYYLLPEHAALRDGFKAFLEKVFTLAGMSDAAVRAQDAFDVEMAVAEPYWSMVRQRDIPAQYNPMPGDAVTAAYPDLHLDIYLQALGIAPQDTIIVEQPDYLAAINQFVASTEPAKLAHYLQARLLRGACGSLSDAFSDASFDFFSRQMAGTAEQKPRWKRAMSAPNQLLGEAVGQMYVERYFPAEYKAKMLQIVKHIQNSLSQHIATLEWMGDSTRQAAQEKLAAFTVKIGYPDKWKDYSSLDISPEKSYYENLRAASAWHVADNLSKLGKPVDKTEWGMTPQTVNAYYNPSTNEICFPAGILQPPFFNPDADDAVNYGAIGVVISHEMTHGFDDQGRLFDKDGNMRDWWTAADAAAFNERAQRLVAQFDAVEVLPGVMANGAATLGENIADHGGLRIAYTAMQESFGDTHPAPIDGLTPEQRFYIAYAAVWAQNITDQEKNRRTLLDVHSLGENRVNVSVRNLDTFFEAFGIREGDPMFRPIEERVIIW
ncbi:MAG: M13 family metallopeptidase [Bacteroidales bacterium]|nr:M13 family metallopeptidase [Bacteroidales bacterium]